MSSVRIAVAIFLATAALLLAMHGQRMVLTNDEGILLESAQRMVAGERIYVDFFGYMSPGSYWLQELVFRLFGFALWTGRLIVILDFAAQSALVYWLVARLSSWRAAAAVTLTFAGFQVADPAFLTSAHRWDSATLALAGMCTGVGAGDRKLRWATSGALMAAAAWCTPSMAIVAAVIAGWLVVSRERRGRLAPFLGGAGVVGLAGVAALAATGSLMPFIAQMAWLRQNYGASNFFPYGSIIGGYRRLFEGTNGFLDLPIRALLVTCVALPALLPPASAGLAGLALWRGQPGEQRNVMVLSILTVTGLVITVFPRADVMHLAFIAALPYALVGSALASLLPKRAATVMAMVSVLLAAMFASNFVRGWWETVQVSSPTGILRISRDQAPVVSRLMQAVRPGDSLFVYPYMPVQYFLTQARNPTRYPYLQPGMMTPAQETEALAELEAAPPEWLLHMRLSRKEFLRVFRSGTSLDWRFPTIEAWMEKNYEPVENPPVSVGGYRLWRRVTAQEASQETAKAN